MNHFYELDDVRIDKDGKIFRTLDIERMAGQRAISDIVDPKMGEVLVKAGRRITRAAVKKVKRTLISMRSKLFPEKILAGKVIAVQSLMSPLVRSLPMPTLK